MKHQPQISINLPIYNAAATLAQTLDSIKEQTFHHYEVVAIDDGSTDQSVAIYESYARNDHRFRLFRCDHQGVVASSNYAIDESRADLIARMDADDIMMPQRLEQQYEYMQRHPEISVVGTQVELFPANCLGQGSIEYIGWQNRSITPTDIANNIYLELPIAHPSALFRKEALMMAGGYRHGAFPEDYELLLRLHSQGHQMGKIPEILLRWRESEKRLTHTDPRYSREAFNQVRIPYLARDKRLQSHRPLVIWGAGRASRKRASLLFEKGFKPAAWIDIDPKKIGLEYHQAKVVPPEWLVQNQKPYILNYVNNHGKRDEIARYLEQRGYHEGSDYLQIG